NGIVSAVDIQINPRLVLSNSEIDARVFGDPAPALGPIPSSPKQYQARAPHQQATAVSPEIESLTGIMDRCDPPGIVLHFDYLLALPVNQADYAATHI